MDLPVPPTGQRQHVNHLNMCRQRRTATKDTTRPVTLWQEGNFFPGRSKVLRYNARTGRRTALSPAPPAERLGDIRKKRPSCLAGGSTAGGRQRIGVREESGQGCISRAGGDPPHMAGKIFRLTDERNGAVPPACSKHCPARKKNPQRKHCSEASAQAAG